MKKSPVAPAQPSLLPKKIQRLHQQLAAAKTDSCRRDAALAIIHAYYKHYSAEQMRAALWQMLAGALANEQHRPLNKARKRAVLLLFYEFTLLLMDAGKVVDEVTNDER